MGISKLKEMRANSQIKALGAESETVQVNLLKTGKEIQDVDFEVSSLSKEIKRMKKKIVRLEENRKKSEFTLVKMLTERLKLCEKFVFRNLI